MLVDIDGPIDPAEFPQGRRIVEMGKAQFAALVDDPADDHRQSQADPRFGPGVEGSIQAEFFGKLEQAAGGPEFFGIEQPAGLRGIDRHDLAAEGGLNELELSQGQVVDAAVGGVLDFALEAEGGANEAVSAVAALLDFEVERRERFRMWPLRYGYNTTKSMHIVKYVWLQMKREK
jgi:hypothetical protein